jgi:outer membrane protein assembly factor BamB
MKCSRLLRVIFVLSACIFCASTIQGQTAGGFDWPAWRGPDHNGVSRETNWNPAAIAKPKVLWKEDVGFGYSNIAIQAGRLYATGDDGAGRFLVTCLDAATGVRRWRQVLKLDIRPEPESTPAVDGDRVYVMTRLGTLLCLRTGDGSTVWQHTLGKDIEMFPLDYGFATSPLVGGNFVLVNVNLAGVALDKMSGKVVWNSGIDIPNSKVASGTFTHSYASPILADLYGKRVAIFLALTALSGVDVSTGEVLWSVAHGSRGSELTGDPVFNGTSVFYTTDHSENCQLDVSAVPLRVVWSNKSLMDGDTSPVAIGGYLYGQSWMGALPSWAWETLRRVKDWPLCCLDAATGAVAWSKPMGYVQLSAAGGYLLLLDLDGTLSTVEATPSAYRPVSSGDVLRGAKRPRLFATPPVLCNGKISCRNYAGDLVSIDVSK